MASQRPCDNCGHKHFLNFCPKCGYPRKRSEFSERGAIDLYFCDKCACYYQDACPKHEEDP
jgi:uncharacterized OB-fold protein